ncbi:MAG: glycosyltransferase, partial [Sedimenticolaceae bacterium]
SRVADFFGDRVELAVTPEHRTLGFARACALERVRTPWLMWLDADDALLPGRAARLHAIAVENGYDAVWDAAELVVRDTARPLPMPDFMLRKNGAVRLFERNWLPGPAWPLLRTDFARDIGYDPLLPAADDLDFNLRACVRQGRLGFCEMLGYRQFAYPDSLSRDLTHQRYWVGEVLRRHSYERVRSLWRAAKFSDAVSEWGLISMAIFREDFAFAASRLNVLDAIKPATHAVLEPHGPWPVPEDWRRSFLHGTLALLGVEGGNPIGALTQAEGLFATPEGANNLGVAWRDCGNEQAAIACFERALSRFPGYLDASLNLHDSQTHRTTTLPLRRIDYRCEYHPPRGGLTVRQAINKDQADAPTPHRGI